MNTVITAKEKDKRFAMFVAVRKNAVHATEPENPIN